MTSEYTNTTFFMRTLLENCVGTIMIEASQWGFPDNVPIFDRGYFNARLKQNAPINSKTQKRLVFIFSYLFNPVKLKGKFDEAEAVNAANSLIKIFLEFFDVDLSIWKNNHAADNRIKRTHLLFCLESVLSMCIDCENLPRDMITDFLQQYLIQENEMPEKTLDVYPVFLTNMPYQQTEHYTGRTTLASRVIEYLLNKRSCFLFGIGGIGKTEIAKDILKSILLMPSSDSEITHIMWVDYIDNSFAVSLVHALFSNTENVNIEQSFKTTVANINRYGNHLLLIVDNVERIDDEQLVSISSYLKCRILITSRCEGYSELIKIPVPPLEMLDCIELFYSYYHGIHDNITLEKIIELTDRHTVTIELLAKIADNEEMSLSDFYDSLIRCGFHVSEEEVTSTHNKMHTEGRIIDQLMKLFKVYGCPPLEKQLLIQVSTVPSIPFVFDQAKKWFELKNRTILNNLSKKGWIKKEALYAGGRNRYRYIIHSVIASAIRAQFIDDLYGVCQSFIRKITIEMQQSQNQNDTIKKGLIQFSWSLNDIFHEQFQSEDDCDFLWALAEIYRDIGFYERALPLLESLSVLYSKLYGSDCIQLGSVWNSKGMIAYELSRFEQALVAYQNSRAILKAKIDNSFVSSHSIIDLAKLNLNIGKIYLKIEFRKAESFFTDAYLVLKKELGDNHQHTLNAYAHKALFLAHSEKFEDAEKIYLEVYNKIKDEKKNRDILLLRAGVAHNLGNLYTDYMPSKAMPFLVEARDIFQRVLSPTNPDTLDVLNTIATHELTLSVNYENSLKEFTKLLDLYIKVYGIDDPNTGTIYNNIGLCHYYLHHYDEAIENYRESLRITALSYGDEHESVAYIYNNIGAVYSDNDNPEKAIPEHEHALKIYKKTYPDNMNLNLAQTHADLADAYLRLGDIDMVQEHLNESFAIYDTLLAEDAFQYLFPCSTLAHLFFAIGDYENAEIQYSHVIWLMLKNGYSENSPSIIEFKERILEVQRAARDNQTE